MFADTIDAVTFPTVADRGRQVPDTSADPLSDVPISGVDAQPGASSELVAQRRDATVIRWVVWVPTDIVPAGVQLTKDGIVRFQDQLYQVDGDPMRWVDGGPLDHLVLLLKTWVH